MIPKRLELENFFSYSELELDFDFSSALIVGENGSGKSTLLEAIAWILFGKSKYKHADNIVKRGRKVAKGVLFFEHDGKNYKIIRKRNAKLASQNSLEFFEILDDGKEKPIKSDTNTELDTKIKDVIKSNYDVFINSSYFKQGQISDFLYGTSAQRQKLISSILNLDRWDTYMDVANKKSKEADKDLSILKYKLSELQTVEEQLGFCESEIDSKKEKNEELGRHGELLGESIRAIEAKINNLKSQSKNLNDFQETKTKLDYVSSKLTELLFTKKEKHSLIEKATVDKTVNERAIFEIDEQIENLLPNLELKDRIEDVSDKESKLRILKVDLDIYSNQIKNLEDGDECLACGYVHTDPIRKNEEIKSIQSKVDALALRIEKGNSVIDRLREYETKVKQTELEIDKYISRKRNIENNIKLQELRIESSENELVLIDKNIEDYSKQKDGLEKTLDSLNAVAQKEDIIELKNDLDLRKKELKDLSTIRDDLFYNIGALNQKLDRLYKEAEKKKVLMAEVAILNNQATVYSSLVRGFGRSGIQAIIIDNVMEELAVVTNEKLNEFTSIPTYVEFITQKKDSKDSWKETLDVNIRTPSGISEFEGLSGGEGFRVAFAIRLALSHIQARRMGGETQLLMLDEVSTCLDPRGIELFVSILRKLEKTMKIMVITHDDNLKEEFEHIISVRKDGEDSILTS